MMTKLKLFLENGTRKLHPDCLKGMIRDHYKKNHSCCDEEWGDDDDGVVVQHLMMRILWQALFFGLLWKAQLWITRYCRHH